MSHRPWREVRPAGVETRPGYLAEQERVGREVALWQVDDLLRRLIVKHQIADLRARIAASRARLEAFEARQAMRR